MKNLRIYASFFNIYLRASPRDLLLLQFAYLYPILGVWLASISIRFWMIGDAKRLRVEVPHARSFPLSISPKDIESEGYIPPVR